MREPLLLSYEENTFKDRSSVENERSLEAHVEIVDRSLKRLFP